MSLVLACTSSTATTDAKPVDTKPVDAKPVDAKPVAPEKPVDENDCDARIADYLTERAALSTCEQDSDCAEMWPGLCPHGPYYVHRDADVGAMIATEQIIAARCKLPACEPPLELGIAHCEAGKCARGRDDPMKGQDPDRTSCWDFRETNLEPDDGVDGLTETKVRPTSPRIVISPAAAGWLRITIDWPETCGACSLDITDRAGSKSTRKSGTASVVTVNGTKLRRERIELTVTAGSYQLVPLGPSALPYRLTVALKDDRGVTAEVTRHGVGWQRLCED